MWGWIQRCLWKLREEISVMDENTVNGNLDTGIASTDICKEKGHTHALSVTC